MSRSFSIRRKILAAFSLPMIGLGAIAAVGVVQSEQTRTEVASALSAEQVNRSFNEAAVALANERLAQFGADEGGDADKSVEVGTTESDEAMERLGQLVGGSQVDRVWTVLGAARSTPVGREDNYSRAIDLLLTDARRVTLGTASVDAATSYADLQTIHRFIEAEDLAWLSFLGRTSNDTRAVSDVISAFSAARNVRDGFDEEVRRRPDGAIATAATATQVMGDLRITALEDVFNPEQSLLSDDAVLDSHGDARQRWMTASTQMSNQIRTTLGANGAVAENQRNQFALFGLAGVLVLGMIGLAVAQSIGDPIERAVDDARRLLESPAESLARAVRNGDEQIPDVTLMQGETTNEVGELVASLNTLQLRYLDLATRESLSRREMSGRFITLSHRTTGLLHELVRHVALWRTADPSDDVGARLFHIDHIATRIQRNVEAALVVGGGRSERRWTTPISAVNTARLALGEVTQFDRVDVKPMSDVRVHGLVAPELAHVLAELIDNGLTAGADKPEPQNRVTVEGEWVSSGWAFLVHDSGVGIAPDEMQRMNIDLHTPSMARETSLSALGFHLISRTAQRLGLDIRLLERPTGGTTARVVLPLDLIDADSVPSDRKQIDAGRGAAMGADIESDHQDFETDQGAAVDAFFGSTRGAAADGPIRAADGGETSPLEENHDVDAELQQMTNSEIPLPLRAVYRRAGAPSMRES